jgi:hypothetical protein
MPGVGRASAELRVCGVVHSTILGGVGALENAVTGGRNYEGHTGWNEGHHLLLQ